MHQDVVGKLTPITTVQSAEAGLLVSLDQRGLVDLPYIATLYEKAFRRSSPSWVIHLPEPDTGAWQTADAYLSGNVRAKLATAEAGNRLYPQRRCSARRPAGGCTGDIDAHLGAPWIPETDIQAFAAWLSACRLRQCRLRI